ncbi:Mth938-like domain-containing protein [Thermodesulfobacteriota bacterium]
MIDDCAFGRIVIDGKAYTSDLIIYPDGHIEDNWWRISGHRLSSGDIQKLIESGPDVIVAGKGVSGQMKPEKELENLLDKQNIKFIAESNQKAMESYNKLVSKGKVGACFHLTC